MVKLGVLDVAILREWFVTDQQSNDPEVIFVKGIADLLTEKAALPLEKCPEPFRIDLQRLQDFQSGLQSVALLGLVAIVTSQFLPKDTSVADAEALFKAVAEETQKPRPQLKEICQVVERCVVDLTNAKGAPPVDFHKLDGALETLRKCLGEDVPAFRLLHDRTCKAFAAALGPPKQQIPQNGLGESPWTLRYAVDHLNSTVDEVWTFLGEHLHVYRSVYSQVVSARPP
jgi:hypothetical protein